MDPMFSPDWSVRWFRQKRFVQMVRVTFYPLLLLVLLGPAWPLTVSMAESNGSRGEADPLPLIDPGGVVNGASLARGAPLSPGSIASLFGTNHAPGEFTSAKPGEGTTVLINGLAAPLLFVSATQINFQVPWELGGSGEAIVSVISGQNIIPPEKIRLASFAPGIFTTNYSGSGQGLILISGSRPLLASAAGSFPMGRPAKRGEFIEILATGLGLVSNPPRTGEVATGSGISVTLTTPTVTIGGLPALVTFSGLVPGFIGVHQIHVQVPHNAPEGDAIPVALSIGGMSSNTVTMAVGDPDKPASAELLEVKKIWDQGLHNAFTDLIRFQGRWYCAFREGTHHDSFDGQLRIISSTDGTTWTTAAVISSSLNEDLREGKLSVTPDGRLMLIGEARRRSGELIFFRSLVWFSSDGRLWSDPVFIGDDVWHWRVTWHKGVAYSIGYNPPDPARSIRLYTSNDGVQFTPLTHELLRGNVNESSLLFGDDDTVLCLLRSDDAVTTAKLGTSMPPYTSWQWIDLGVRIASPQKIRLPDGRIVAAARLVDTGNSRIRTSLSWLDPKAGTLTEFLTLPSLTDTGYPGMVLYEGLLWVSYYSTHEGKTSIYLAKVKLPTPS